MLANKSALPPPLAAYLAGAAGAFGGGRFNLGAPKGGGAGAPAFTVKGGGAGTEPKEGGWGMFKGGG